MRGLSATWAVARFRFLVMIAPGRRVMAFRQTTLPDGRGSSSKLRGGQRPHPSVSKSYLPRSDQNPSPSSFPLFKRDRNSLFYKSGNCPLSLTQSRKKGKKRYSYRNKGSAANKGFLVFSVLCRVVVLRRVFVLIAPIFLISRTLFVREEPHAVSILVFAFWLGPVISHFIFSLGKVESSPKFLTFAPFKGGRI